MGVGRRHLIVHPFFVAAVALLAVNDVFLKAAWPGLVTGKLSDLAGVFVIGVVLFVITGRRLESLAVTAVGFAALKLVPGVALLAAPFLGGVTRTDPTDLVGLLALWPAYWFIGTVGRSADGPVEPARPGSEAIRASRNALLLVMSGITLFTVTATSCESATQVYDLRADPDGVIAVVEGSWFTERQYLSTDGGLTWNLIAETEPDGTAEELGTATTAPSEPESGDAEADFVNPGTAVTTPDLEDAPGPEDATPAPRAELTEACLDDGTCYRVVDNERVERRVDGGDWNLAFRFTAEELRRMELRADSCSGEGDADDLFGFLAPANSASGDQTIVVSTGTQGVVAFDPDTGGWERRAVGPAEPLSLDGPSWLADLYYSPLLALFLSPLVFFINRGTVSATRRTVGAVTGVGLAGCVAVMTLFLIVVSFGRAGYAVVGPFVAICSVAALIVAMLIVLPKGKPPPPPLPHQRPRPPLGPPTRR